MLSPGIKTEEDILRLLKGMGEALDLAGISLLREMVAPLILMQAITLWQTTEGGRRAIQSEASSTFVRRWKGWRLADHGRESHYFVSGKPLCGKMGLTPGRMRKREDSTKDCAECQKRLSNRTASNLGVGR